MHYSKPTEKSHFLFNCKIRYAAMLCCVFSYMFLGCGSQSERVSDTSTSTKVQDQDVVIPQAIKDEDAFVTTWKIDTPDTVITLPLPKEGQDADENTVQFYYNFRVDWGDGSEPQTITAFNDPDISHTYQPRDELYEIRIEGELDAWSFRHMDPARKVSPKLIGAPSLGKVGWKNLEGAFAGAFNLKSVGGGDTSEVTNMSWMFSGAKALEQVDLSQFNFSNVTKTDYMFVYTTALGCIDLSSTQGNFSKLKNMASMFSHSGVKKVNFENQDLSQVTRMHSLFAGSEALKEVSFKGVDFSNIKYLSFMFLGTPSLKFVDFTGVKMWGLNIKDKDPDSEENDSDVYVLDLRVNEDYHLFESSALDEVFCPSSFEPGDNFYGKMCSGNVPLFVVGQSSCSVDNDAFITQWEIADPDTTITLPLNAKELIGPLDEDGNPDQSESYIESYEFDFTVDWGDSTPKENIIHRAGDLLPKHVYQLPGIYTVTITGKLEAWSFGEHATDSRNKLIGIDAFGDVGWKSLKEAFSGCTNLRWALFKNAALDNVTDVSGMFFSNASLETISLKDLQLPKVVNLSHMFAFNKSLTHINLDGLFLSNAESLQSMFFHTEALTNIALKHLNLSKIKNTSNMFDGSGITSIDLSEANFEQLKNVEAMFHNTPQLTRVNLEGINFSTVKSTDQMFKGASQLSELNLDVMGKDFSAVLTANLMFEGLTKLQGIDFQNANFKSLAYAAGMFQNTKGLEHVNLNSANLESLARVTNMFFNGQGIKEIDFRNVTFPDNLSAIEYADPFSNIPEDNNFTLYCSQPNIQLFGKDCTR